MMKMMTGRSTLIRSVWSVSALFLMGLAGCAGSPGPGEPAATGNEVDIGYGTVGQESLAEPTSTVEGDAPEAPRFRTLIEMLARVPGVRVIERPGGEISVRVRGASSFRSGEEPLIVLDGQALPSLAGVTSLNANNIASITVLKDAGETAIYGARGANGVILIKTKR